MAGYLGNTQKISGSYTVDEFTSSGGTTYTLTKAPGAKNNIQVSAGGLVQYPSAYSVSGTTLTLSGVPSGQKVVVRHMGETILYPALDDGIVTSAKIASNSVTGAKIALGSDAAGDTLYYNGTDYVRLAKGAAAQVLTMNGGATAPAWATAAAGGKVIQVVNTVITAAVTGTTTMPIDDTIPQNTEGNECITRAITPTNASNLLLIMVNLKIGYSTTGMMSMALFQDSTANAIAANSSHLGTAGEQFDLSMNHYMTAGTTSATTFKVRVGKNGGGTMFLNANSGGRLYGGVSSSTLIIMEIGA